MGEGDVVLGVQSTRIVYARQPLIILRRAPFGKSAFLLTTGVNLSTLDTMHDLFNVESFGFQILAMASTALLCLLLGIERYFHQKNAGVKTHVLVGLGACLFTLVSGFGFAGATGAVDPSRIAAQIVSGIGFLGAGLIFVNNDTVKGLTTAATIWVSAAIGMACGAGLVPLAFATIAIHYVLIFLVWPLVARLPASHRHDRTVIEYEIGHGTMPAILVEASRHGYKATVKSTAPIQTEHGRGMRVVMHFEGPHPQDRLIHEIAEIEGVYAVDRVEQGGLE